MSDRAAKRARLGSPNPGTFSADISSIVQELDADELRDILAAEAERNHHVLESVTQYFDITRNNTSVISIEYYINRLRVAPPIRGHYGPIAMQNWRDRWEQPSKK